MIYIDLPNIDRMASPEQQLAEIRSYIYRNNEQINAALSNLSSDKVWESAIQALTAGAEVGDELPEYQNRYKRLRDLIIKTADSIVKTDERWEMALSGSYLAKSQFGDYLLNTSVEVEGSSTGFLDLYNYSAALGSDYGRYKQDVEAYIKRGLLDDSGASPVYGIEVGLLKNTFTTIDEHGEETTMYTVAHPYRTRITPDRWSFMRDNSEVAYITEDSFCFPKATISGGSININNNFQVTPSGILTARGGNFTWSNASGGMNVSGSGFSFYETETVDDQTVNQKTFSLSPQTISFYHVDSETYDTPIAHIKRGIRENRTESALEIDLKTNCAFFSLLYSIPGQTPERAITFIPQSATTTLRDTRGLFFSQSSEFEDQVKFKKRVDFDSTVSFNTALALSQNITMNAAANFNGNTTLSGSGTLNINTPGIASGTVTTPHVVSDGHEAYKDHVFYVKGSDDSTLSIHVRNGLVTLS